MHYYEEVPVAYGISTLMPSLSLMPHQGKAGGRVTSCAGEYDNIARKSPYMVVGMESPYNSHPTVGLDNALIPCERRVTQEEDVIGVERKREVSLLTINLPSFSPSGIGLDLHAQY